MKQAVIWYHIGSLVSVDIWQSIAFGMWLLNDYSISIFNRTAIENYLHQRVIIVYLYSRAFIKKH